MSGRGIAAALPAALVLAGCSDDEGGSDADESAGKGAMSQESLKAIALEVRSVVGGGTVETDDLAELGDDHGTDRQECQPLAALAGLDPEPAAMVHREVDGAGFSDPTTEVRLLSYGGDGATDVLGQLREAGEECADGYVEERLDDIEVVSVEPVEAPSVGDEALAFRIVTMTNDATPKERPGYLTVVRAGHELLAFETATLDLSDPGGVPEGVVDAQWERYAAAAD